MTLDGSAYHHGDLRSALLAEAAVMISEGGTSSVTMRATGRRLGVSRFAPYRHFADKSALLVAVAAAGFDRTRPPPTRSSPRRAIPARPAGEDGPRPVARRPAPRDAREKRPTGHRPEQARSGRRGQGLRPHGRQPHGRRGRRATRHVPVRRPCPLPCGPDSTLPVPPRRLEFVDPARSCGP